MGVTGHDVARLAGVSQATVSRALAGGKGISAQTQARVKAAAEALKYAPSDAGRALSTRRTSTIGIVTGELTNPFYPELVEPIRAALIEHGYRPVLIPDSRETPFDPTKWLRGVFDGLILTTARSDWDLAFRLTDAGVPFVFANREISTIEADRCVAANERGARQIADFFLDRGHTAIAAIMGPSDTSTGSEREKGFLDRLAERGHAMSPGHIMRGEFGFDEGARAAARLVSAVAPTAIFCANDVLAMGAANVLHEMRAEQATETTLVGFDDIRSAGYPLYNLTTVHVDIASMARTAVDLLLERLDSPELPYRRVVLPAELVVRGPGLAAGTPHGGRPRSLTHS